MKRLLLAAVLGIAAAGAARAQDGAPTIRSEAPEPEFKAQACKDKHDGFYCAEVGNEHRKINCTNGKVAAQLPCPGGCVPDSKECKQSTGGAGPFSTDRPAAPR